MSNKKLVILDSNGAVVKTVLGTDPYNFIPSVYGDVSPVIVDADIPDITINLYTPNARSSVANPYTEQLLTGTKFGSFFVNEQGFQSTIVPQVVNGYSTTEFYPVVVEGVCQTQFLGEHCAKFMGSYLDTDTNACGLKLPPFPSGGMPYFLVEGFVYLETTPSGAYDPIVLTRSADGINSSTQDSFRLQYDTSDQQFVFQYSTTSNGSAGYNKTLLVCPVGGVTLQQWHHFAVAYANSGGSASCASYWNGNRTDMITTSGGGNIRNSTKPVMVGSGISGGKPLKGYLDDICISGGASSISLRSFAAMGLTAPVPTDEISAGDYTVYLLTMHGPVGTSLFPCDNLERVSSCVSYIDQYNSVIGVSVVTREDTSVAGFTLFGGVCGGHTASDSGKSAGYYFGYNSGACMVIGSVEQVQGVSAAKKLRGSLADFTISYLLGSTAMQGASGNSGDFKRLFANSWGGTRYSFLPTQSNISVLRNLYDDIVVNGRNETFTISDVEGNLYQVNSGAVKSLYQDVLEYHNDAVQQAAGVKSAVSTATTVSQVFTVAGMSGSGLIQKIAPTIDSVGTVFITSKARVSKTKVPETKYTSIKEIYPLEGGLAEL